MILVFGKYGQVAAELSKIKNVVSLDRNQADLSNPISCSQAIEFYSPKGVINAAAYTDVDKSEVDEENAKIVNVYSPKAIADTCFKLSIPLIHISTEYVFSGNGNKPWKPTDIPAPLGTYGKTKFQGENAIKSSGCFYVILRTSWVFSEIRKNFVKSIINLSEMNDEIKVVYDQIGAPTPAKCLAQDCISILSQLIKNPMKSGTYHYCGTPNISRSNFAKIILSLSKKNNTVIPITSFKLNSGVLRPLNSRLDCSSTLKTFDIAQPDWKLTLREVLREINV